MARGLTLIAFGIVFIITAITLATLETASGALASANYANPPQYQYNTIESAVEVLYIAGIGMVMLGALLEVQAYAAP